jgi:hypothetical protein
MSGALPDPAARAAPALPELERDPAARRARRRPVTLSVRFARAPGVLQTLEGPVRYRAGAALVCGLRGECWPVERGPFERRYEPAAGTAPGSDGAYRRQAGIVLARRLDATLEVRVGAHGDLLRGRPGDWLLQYAPGEYGIVAPEIFADTYALIADADADAGAGAGAGGGGPE